MEPSSPTSKLYPYPKCRNNNEARSICLSEECQDYPFYCAVCEEEVCQIKHLHGSKIVSTGFREFMKKIQQHDTPRPELLEVCEKYRSSLVKLRQDTIKFVEKELVEIDALLKKSTEFPEGEKTIVKRIVDREFDTLKGFEMDKVWSCINLKDDNGTERFASEIAYIKNKTDEINEIAADFEKVISIMDNPNAEESKPDKPPAEDQAAPPTLKKDASQKTVQSQLKSESSKKPKT